MAANRQMHGGVIRRRRRMLIVPALLVGWLLAGCTAIVEYKDYDVCDFGDEQTVRDLQFSMDGMDIHNGQLVEIRVVNVSDIVVARAILDPLVGSSFQMRMRGALQEGPHRIDFFADLSTNGQYDVPPTDHAWRLAPCASGNHRFSHSTNFADVEDPEPKVVGFDFVLNLDGMTPHVGQLLEFWVIDQANGRMVGYYRLSEPLEPAFTIAINEVGIPLVEAVRMASLTPARVIGVDDRKGSIEAGKDADLAIFNDDFAAWRVMIGGRWVKE